MDTPDSEENRTEQPEKSKADATEPESVRLHAIVHGYVQGVGFRANTQRTANQAGITGWVKNRWDDTVEVVAEGPRDVLERFEQFLHQGPRAADVDHVEITYGAATGEFSRFSVRY
jgi:acylphosphatase